MHVFHVMRVIGTGKDALLYVVMERLETMLLTLARIVTFLA